METLYLVYWALVALLALLQVADAHSTYVALTQIKQVREKNPIIQKFMDIFGLKLGLIIPKFLFLALIWWMGQPTWYHIGAFAFLGAWYIAVVGNNYRIIKKHTGSYMGKAR